MKPIMRHRIIPVAIFLLFLSFNQNSKAQTDTEFWFVSPPAHDSNGAGTILDEDIYLRFSTLDLPSTVTISQPANPGFVPIVITIAANSTHSELLTAFKSDIENQPVNTNLDKGIYISATTPINAYYEIESSACDCNPEIFALKGKNALGAEFYVPFQTAFDNASWYPTSRAYFSIVATEDNTLIAVTPSTAVLGHPSGIAFTINLNKGQTYTVEADNQIGSSRPTGSHVVSDKPVAITMLDDLVSNSICADMVGDQLIPVDVTGTSYAVVAGDLLPNDEVFVVATENLTSVSIDGSLMTTLNAGDSYRFSLTSSVHTITTSAPAYALHISGSGCEVAASYLPTLECSGSYRTGFTRSSDEQLTVFLIAEIGSEGSFIFDGSSSVFVAGDFTAIPSTTPFSPPKWAYAKKVIPTSILGEGDGAIVENTQGRFQMGIINGNNATGTRYGYFSSFRKSTPETHEYTLCSGNILLLDAGEDGWYVPDPVPELPGDDFEFPGDGGGVFSDDPVFIGSGSDFPIGGDLDLSNPCYGYQWSTGDTSRFITITGPGIYTVDIMSECCSRTDTYIVTESELDITAPDLGETKYICTSEGDVVTIGTEAAYHTYQWSTGETSASVTVSSPGTYVLTVGNEDGCTTSVSIDVVDDCPVEGDDDDPCGDDYPRCNFNIVGDDWVCLESEPVQTYCADHYGVNSDACAGTYELRIIDGFYPPIHVETNTTGCFTFDWRDHDHWPYIDVEALYYIEIWFEGCGGTPKDDHMYIWVFEDCGDDIYYDTSPPSSEASSRISTPNPASTFLNLKLPVSDRSDSFKAELYNNTGYVVRSIESTGKKYQIPLDDLAPGTYLLKVTTSEKVYTEKVIITR